MFTSNSFQYRTSLKKILKYLSPLLPATWPIRITRTRINTAVQIPPLFPSFLNLLLRVISNIPHVLSTVLNVKSPLFSQVTTGLAV